MEYEENKILWLEREKAIIKKDYKKIGGFSEFPVNSVANLIEYYKKSADYDCPLEQAQEEVEYIVDKYQDMLDGTLEDSYSFPVMNTPFEVDRKLKWICPVPCVREYLHKQCGVNTKWEWFYRLFWKGKKHF